MTPSKIDSMSLFKKVKKPGLSEEKKQLQISNKWKAIKQEVAGYLQKKSELLSAQTKKYSLIFFCLLFGGSSVAVIVHSATTKAQAIKITQISKPAHSMQEEQNYLNNDSLITKREYDKVEQFKSYLYQLKNDSLYSIKFDSIITARPQLIDSINLFEKMYLQQK